jgi:hypothetical protein
MAVFLSRDMRRRAATLTFSAVSGLAAIMLPLGASAQNLVRDGGFESSTSSGSSPGWTLSSGNGTSFYNARTDGGSYALTGNWAADFTAISAGQASSGRLSQTIAVAPMTSYVVSFFLRNSGGPHDTFLATFGGQTVLSLTDAPASAYTRYSATITTGAKSRSAVLAFTGEQDSADFYLDDVSVVLEGAPAPAVGGGLMSFAIAAVGVAAWRRRSHRHAAFSKECAGRLGGW